MTKQTDAERLAEIRRRIDLGSWPGITLDDQRYMLRLLDAATSRQEGANEIERAYGLLWLLPDDSGSSLAFQARQLLLPLLDRDAKRRGVAWASAQPRDEPARPSAPSEAQVEAVARAAVLKVIDQLVGMANVSPHYATRDRETVALCAEYLRDMIAALSAIGQGAVCKESLQGAEAIGQGEDERIEADELRALLAELHALVWHECPSVLNEDSGASVQSVSLDLRINEALARHASRQAGKR